MAVEMNCKQVERMKEYLKTMFISIGNGKLDIRQRLVMAKQSLNNMHYHWKGYGIVSVANIRMIR